MVITRLRRGEIILVIKRDGSIAEFDLSKIENAIFKAGSETGEFGFKESTSLALKVRDKIFDENDVEVEEIQDKVEYVLLDSKYKKTAKAYILYRANKNEERRPDIFKKRVNLKPVEYPIMDDFKESIQHTYWLFSEFNFTNDIQDFHVSVNETERNAIKNAMLAISQVEVAVKTFWGNLQNRIPKPEVGAVGSTFADNEVRHSDAYSHLLKILGLDEEFERISDIPALNQRVQYLERGVHLAKTESDKDYTKSILLFSLFVEHVSLFSQFLIVMAFNKHKNLFKGISNVIEATSKEEQIHGLFGIELINIIKSENPSWFDDELEKDVYEACKEAYYSEEVVIDWIYEAGDLDFVPKNSVKEFVKHRLNSSLESIGYQPIFEVDDSLLDDSEWFIDEIIASTNTDFFYKRSTAYLKKAESVTGDDLFD